MFTELPATETRRYFEFKSGQRAFTVSYSAKLGCFDVYAQQACTPSHWARGKVFWKANDMIGHYKTAAVQLALIASACAA